MEPQQVMSRQEWRMSRQILLKAKTEYYKMVMLISTTQLPMINLLQIEKHKEAILIASILGTIIQLLPSQEPYRLKTVQSQEHFLLELQAINSIEMAA